MIHPYTPPQSGIDQQKMISLLKDKKKEGFDLLYDTYSIALYKVSLHITCDEQKAAHVVENAFIFIWKNIKTYTPSQSSFGVWLVWIVKQEASRMGHSPAIN